MSVKVTLLTHTPNPEQVVAMAAKLCYSPSNIDDLMEKQYKKVQSYEEFWHTEYVCRGEQDAK